MLHFGGTCVRAGRPSEPTGASARNCPLKAARLAVSGQANGAKAPTRAKGGRRPTGPYRPGRGCMLQPPTRGKNCRLPTITRYYYGEEERAK